MSATTNEVKQVDDTNKTGNTTEEDLIRELIEACEGALKLRGLECSILTKKELQPNERHKFRNEAADTERKIRAAIAKARQMQSTHPADRNEKDAGQS